MTHRRNEFSKATMREAYLRSGGICECHRMLHIFKSACGCALGEGNTYYEHVDPDAISGRNDIENCAVLTKTCWKFKTAMYDLPTIAKVKRVSDLAKGIKDPWRRRLPGARDSDLRLKVGGGVVDRRTGLPWRGSQ